MSVSANAAWLAGLFEGEGYFGARTSGNYGRRYWRIQISMTDRDVVERVREFTGVGRVTSTEKDPPRKLLWNWRCNRPEHIYYVLMMIYPLLGNRRRGRADEFLKWFGQQRPLNRCPHGHSAPHPRPQNWKCRVCKQESNRRFSRKKAA